MGDSTTEKMKTFVLFVALAVAVYAHDPTQDVVPEADDLVLPVPDDTFVETSAQEAAQEVAQLQQAAHAKATSFLAKKGANACKALADSTAKAVTDNIAAQQEIINKMDKGAKCSEEGQQAITAMKGKLTKAEKDKKAADKAYDDAMDTDVDFGKYKFSTLKKGECSQFYSSSAYTAAEKKVKEAKNKKTQAAGKVTQAKNDVTAAEKAATRTRPTRRLSRLPTRRSRPPTPRPGPRRRTSSACFKARPWTSAPSPHCPRSKPPRSQR